MYNFQILQKMLLCIFSYLVQVVVLSVILLRTLHMLFRLKEKVTALKDKIAANNTSVDYEEFHEVVREASIGRLVSTTITHTRVCLCG